MDTARLLQKTITGKAANLDLKKCACCNIKEIPFIIKPCFYGYVVPTIWFIN
jgi:hypothetical protein